MARKDLEREAFSHIHAKDLGELRQLALSYLYHMDVDEYGIEVDTLQMSLVLNVYLRNVITHMITSPEEEVPRECPVPPNATVMILPFVTLSRDVQEKSEDDQEADAWTPQCVTLRRTLLVIGNLFQRKTNLEMVVFVMISKPYASNTRSHVFTVFMPRPNTSNRQRNVATFIDQGRDIITLITLQ